MDAGLSSKTTPVAAWEDQIRAVVGREHLRTANAGDFASGVAPKFVVEPGSDQEIAKVLAIANEPGAAVIPRGGGTKLEWGNPPTRADLVLSMARLNRVIEHAWSDLTVTVEAGCTIQKLQEMLAKHGQRIALDPLWPERATVGGVLSTNDSGALRLRFGSLRDLIIGITLALPDGTVASSGGKVVKNVAGYDLQKLATGAFGTLGVITRAVFRVHPLPKNSLTLTIAAPHAEQAQRVILSIQASRLAHVALQTSLGNQSTPVIDVLFEGTTPGLIGQRTQLEKLIAPLTATDARPTVWTARQGLFSLENSTEAAAVAKISILPVSIATTAELIARTAHEQKLPWRAAIQATGIGWLTLAGTADGIFAALQSLRVAIEDQGGSLVLLRRPAGMAEFDAWGNPGDALPLMRAVKQQFDPRGTLNPGRFVRGI
jgi:glycolate oxidase FAD binding subunit